MGITVLPPDINESRHGLQGRLHRSARGATRRSRARTACKRRAGPADPLRPRRGARRRRRGARGDLRGARRGRPVRRSLRFRRARRREASSTRRVFEALVQCGAFDPTLGASRASSRARAFASIDVALERSRARARDRERGQTNLFGLFDAAAPARRSQAARRRRLRRVPRRGTARRCSRASGSRSASTSPVTRSSATCKGGTCGASRRRGHHASCAGQEDWAVVKLAGMVEGYRERIFRTADGKIAFFELEDLSGRVEREGARQPDRDLRARAHGGRARARDREGELPAPRRGRARGGHRRPRASRRSSSTTRCSSPTSSRADTRAARAAALGVAGPARPAREGARRAPLGAGECPVSLVPDAPRRRRGALLVRQPSFRVEVGDPVLVGLERIFGAQVAELR